jgi:hypothetical protein
MDPTSLQINFGDPDDIRANLPRVQVLLAEKKAQLDAAQRDYNLWEQFWAIAVQLAGAGDQVAEPPATDHTDQRSDHAPDRAGQGAGPSDQVDSSDRTDDGVVNQVVAVVDRDNRPIRPREVSAILKAEGIELDNNTTASALYYAALRATPRRIRKLAQRGLYAPLTYIDPPQTDYQYAGSIGFPVPDHPPAEDREDDDP